MGNSSSQALTLLEQARRVLKALKLLSFDGHKSVLVKNKAPIRQSTSITRPYKRSSKRYRAIMRERRRRGNVFGSLAQIRVTRLLRLLEKEGKVAWFKESEKYSWFDRRGVDHRGELNRHYGGVKFTIDVKSSLRHIKPGQGRTSLIFVPKDTETDAAEARRLLDGILEKFFDERRQHNAYR